MSAHHRTAQWAAVTRTIRPILRATLPAPCSLCGRPVYPDQRWSVDHIVPLSQGGTDAPHNLAAAHARCQSRQGGRLAARKQAATRKQRTEYPNW